MNNLHLVIPHEESNIKKKIQSFERYKNVEYTIDDSLSEPLLIIYPGQKTPFGFANMFCSYRDKKNQFNYDNLPYYESSCPNNCTNDLRKWLCKSCGYLIKSSQEYLICNCGYKKHNSDFFKCILEKESFHIYDAIILLIVFVFHVFSFFL